MQYNSMQFLFFFCLFFIKKKNTLTNRCVLKNPLKTIKSDYTVFF